MHEAVAGAGVPAPAPVTVVDDERWLGVPFLVMPYVAGHVPGQAPALDPWVTGSSAALQRALYEGFVDTVAAVNRVDWATAGLGTVVRGGAPAAGAPGSLEAELDWWARYVAWSCDGVPLAGLDQALAWCVETRPAPGAPPSLLWGDARLGNLVVGEDRSVRAVLDWELASIGPAELDLGWLLALEWTMDELLGLGGPRVPRARGDRFPLRGRAGAAGHRPGLARGLRPGSLAGGEQPSGPGGGRGGGPLRHGGRRAQPARGPGPPAHRRRRGLNPRQEAEPPADQSRPAGQSRREKPMSSARETL